ncbi:MAG TPA: DUF2202 domain-containing protein [Longilinea sp.]|nr:DUF2202 domain-containing protein [Longilinea sp.]
MNNIRKISITVIVAIALLAVVFVPTNIVAASTEISGGGPGGNGGNGGYGGGMASGQGSAGSGLALGPLSDVEITALQAAILEEYIALNTYQEVIDQFGSVYPFNQIVLSEQSHVNALVRLAVKYGVEVPGNPGLTTSTTYADLAEACEAGAALEIADADLYDTLIPTVTHTDLTRVFTNLQSASLNSHLPAFESSY